MAMGWVYRSGQAFLKERSHNNNYMELLDNDTQKFSSNYQTGV